MSKENIALPILYMLITIIVIYIYLANREYTIHHDIYEYDIPGEENLIGYCESDGICEGELYLENEFCEDCGFKIDHTKYKIYCLEADKSNMMFHFKAIARQLPTNYSKPLLEKLSEMHKKFKLEGKF